jgi:hypothetical protein
MGKPGCRGVVVVVALDLLVMVTMMVSTSVS